MEVEVEEVDVVKVVALLLMTGLDASGDFGGVVDGVVEAADETNVASWMALGWLV